MLQQRYDQQQLCGQYQGTRISYSFGLTTIKNPDNSIHNVAKCNMNCQIGKVLLLHVGDLISCVHLIFMLLKILHYLISFCNIALHDKVCHLSWFTLCHHETQPDLALYLAHISQQELITLYSHVKCELKSLSVTSNVCKKYNCPVLTKSCWLQQAKQRTQKDLSV